MGYITALLVSLTIYGVKSEGKVVPVQAMEESGVVQVWINLLLSALDGGGRSALRPGRFTFGERVACNH